MLGSYRFARGCIKTNGRDWIRGDLPGGSADCFEFIEDPDAVTERPDDVPFVGCDFEDDVATQFCKCCGCILHGGDPPRVVAPDEHSYGSVGQLSQVGYVGVGTWEAGKHHD